MNRGGSSGNRRNLRPLLPAQVQDCDGGVGMWNNNNWVWPPPRILNSAQLTNDGGMCPCIPQLQSQQQQQQQQQSQQQHFPHINPVHHQSVHSLPGNNPGPLRFLFCKELTHSDIMKKNKIILPRREVETHFPRLESRQGIQFLVEDDLTKEIWRFRFRYRNTTNSRIHAVEGTRQFVQFHELKEGDCMVFYKDDARARYVVGVSKRPPIINLGNLDVNAGSWDYAYFNQLSDYSIVDEMQEAATPSTPYLYGDATCSRGDLVSCELEKLAPLDTFKFDDLPLDHMF